MHDRQEQFRLVAGAGIGGQFGLDLLNEPAHTVLHLIQIFFPGAGKEESGPEEGCQRKAAFVLLDLQGQLLGVKTRQRNSGIVCQEGGTEQENKQADLD